MANEQERIVQAIFEFSGEMEDKMLQKFDDGLRGWDDKLCADIIEKKLKENLERADYIDVANLAMMLHRFQKGTNETVS
jgi:hypothetical protein